jgi:hypothetical protein
VELTPYPTPLQHFKLIPQGLLIRLHSHHYTFNSLIDTGATHSFIDAHLVHILKIPILPSSGSPIELASIKHPAPRIGITPLIEFTPVLVHTTLKPLPPRAYAFELLHLPTHKYQFIIGMDLIRSIFKKSIPLSLLPPKEDKKSRKKSSVNTLSRQGSFEHSHMATLVDSIPPGDIPDVEGIGHYPSIEQPERVSTFTPQEQEEKYARERDRIMSDPEIQEALSINDKIRGFCSIPESVLRLRQDPVKKAGINLNIRQYHIPESVKEPANKVVMRWLQEGRITHAPAGCQYNNPITVAPKKDDNGQLTGIRVCLDVRHLNRTLTDCDNYEIPIIRDVLSNMKGCTVFGEFDLAEAYLQFRLHPDSQTLTAFTWGPKRVQYMFVGCPFGILELPSHFQRMMQHVFHDLPFTFPYFDTSPSVLTRGLNTRHIHSRLSNVSTLTISVSNPHQ